MSRLRVGVTRYASVAAAIERRLAVGARPECRIGQGRLSIVLRGVGATRWEPAAQVERALEMAAVARELLAADPRARVRAYARNAVVIRFEDAGLARGCAVRAEWECVVPAGAG